MSDRTSITKLPETDNNASNNYTPLNIHTPQFIHNNGLESIQDNHRLPSRDIAINSNDYTNDNQIKANYIPPVKNVKDYIKHSREDEYIQSRSHKLKKQIKLSFFQEFILLTILMFIFQMTIINSILHKYSTSLGIFEIDGQLNKTGMIFKSSLFSFIYMLIHTSQSLFIKWFQYL